jgi:hypothetical protein
MTPRRLYRIAAAVLALSVGGAWAQDHTFTALFIFNFAKCVEWPTTSGDFVIGVLGDDPVTKELQAIAGKTKLGEQSIVIQGFESAEKAGRCNILYVTPGQSGTLASVIEKFGADSVLVVTNKKGLAQAGSPINLVNIDGKLRYEINVDSFKKTGLKAKPVLFKLGTAVGS